MFQLSRSKTIQEITEIGIKLTLSVSLLHTGKRVNTAKEKEAQLVYKTCQVSAQLANRQTKKTMKVAGQLLVKKRFKTSKMLISQSIKRKERNA